MRMSRRLSKREVPVDPEEALIAQINTLIDQGIGTDELYAKLSSVSSNRSEVDRIMEKLRESEDDS